MTTPEFYAAMAMRELIKKQVGDFEETDYEEIAYKAAQFARELYKQTELFKNKKADISTATWNDDDDEIPF